jgi:hypothetical protein
VVPYPFELRAFDSVLIVIVVGLGPGGSKSVCVDPTPFDSVVVSWGLGPSGSKSVCVDPSPVF